MGRKGRLEPCPSGSDTRVTVARGPMGSRPQGSPQISTAAANQPGFHRQPSPKAFVDPGNNLETQSRGAFKAGLFMFLFWRPEMTENRTL